MPTDREILQALDFNVSNSDLNQNSKVTMPKILLEDEVSQVKSNSPNSVNNAPNISVKEETSPESNSQVSFNLEDIFNKEFLAQLTTEDLDKPLKDIILSKTEPNPSWQYYAQQQEYVCKFTFESNETLSYFLTNIFQYVNCIYKLETPNSIEVYISNKDKSYINTVNLIYKELVKKKVKPDIELDYKDLHIPLSYAGEVVQKFENGKDYILKIPVAKIGKWKHPIYEEVSFTSQDLDSILENFRNKELGFEPPVYFGHSAGDGTPAQGYLQNLEREDDILFGYWQVNKEAYRLVEDEVYRYSSAEIILNLTSKKTGKKIGKAIYGMALTNIPFVPDLPKIQALEHANINSNVVFLSFSKSNDIENDQKLETLNIDNSSNLTKMEQQLTNQMELALKEQVEAYAAKVKELELTRQELEQANKLKELKAQIEQYSQQETKYKETEQKLSTVVEQNKQLADKLEEYEQSIRQKEVESKVSKLNTLPLPTDFKQVYSNLIKEGRLGEVEEIVLSSLESLAGSYTNQLLEQTGSTEDTSNLNNKDYEDPYQAEIERCKRLIEQRIK